MIANYAHCNIYGRLIRPCYNENEAKRTAREFMDSREDCLETNSSLLEKARAHMDKNNNRVGADIWYRLGRKKSSWWRLDVWYEPAKQAVWDELMAVRENAVFFADLNGLLRHSYNDNLIYFKGTGA